MNIWYFMFFINFYEFFNNKQIRLSDNVTNIPIYENTSKSCIVGNVGRKKESLGNEDFMYVLTFTPTKEAVLNLGIKTEQIFTIIEDFSFAVTLLLWPSRPKTSAKGKIPSAASSPASAAATEAVTMCFESL